MSWPRGRSVDGGLDHLPLPRTTGAIWLCGKRVVGPDPEAALERANAADAIVAFSERAELMRDYPGYVEWLDANTDAPVSDGAGPRAWWFPIPDLHAPPIDHALEIVGALTARLEQGDALVLHCAGGIGRAPTMAICVLLNLGMSLDTALAHVAEHRPMGGPEVGAQRRLVEEMARRLAS